MPNKRLVLFKSFVVSSFQLKFCLHFFYSFKKRLVLTHSLETISRSLPRFWKSFPCQRSWQSLSWIQIFSEVPQNPISKSSVSEKKKKQVVFKGTLIWFKHELDTFIPFQSFKKNSCKIRSIEYFWNNEREGL